MNWKLSRWTENVKFFRVKSANWKVFRSLEDGEGEDGEEEDEDWIFIEDEDEDEEIYLVLKVMLWWKLSSDKS